MKKFHFSATSVENVRNFMIFSSFRNQLSYPKKRVTFAGFLQKKKTTSGFIPDLKKGRVLKAKKGTTLKKQGTPFPPPIKAFGFQKESIMFSKHFFNT